MSKEEIDKLVKDTHDLKKYQEEPSTKEELEKIPLLAREDIKKQAAPFITKEHVIDDTVVLHQNVFTNGIGYLGFYFNCEKVSNELLPYLGLLKYMIGSVDTSNYLPILTKKHHVFNLANNEASQYNEIMQDYCRGETYEFPIQARMAQEHKLATDLAWHKDLYLLSILKRREQNKFDVKAPVLIFYQYTAVYEHLKNLLHVAYPDYNIIGINGFTNLTSDELSKPKSNNSIYLVQYEAGGEGLDWQWSNISIFYEAPVRYEKFVQAKGRNLRNKSQMAHVYHFELEYANTLDSERWETNRGKRDFTDDVSERTFKAQVAKFKNLHN